VFATSAGSVAQDGTGKNGLFTGQLLNNLKKPGLEVNEVFRLTGADVSRASEGKQVPAINSQFFGTAYLGPPPSAQPAPGGTVRPTPQPAVSRGQSWGSAAGYGAMNLALGLGSFIQEDWSGGITIVAGYGAAAGLIAWELSMKYEDKLAGIPGTAGLGVAGVTAVYGFIRPMVYQKNRRLAGIADRINIAVVSENRGEGIQLSYTLKF
jgi:hypothetical protein